jgi:hypothetical protein
VVEENMSVKASLSAKAGARSSSSLPSELQIADLKFEICNVKFVIPKGWPTDHGRKTRSLRNGPVVQFSEEIGWSI